MPSPKDRPDAYTSQVNSPLFYLPRELRDEIYQYYAFEENGYFHNIDTGKLSLADREPIDLRLTYTCRAVAEEMKKIPLSSNYITFTTGDIEDTDGFLGLRSRAGRFKQVLSTVNVQRCLFFFQVLNLITPPILESVIAKFGPDGRCIAETVASARNGNGVPKRFQPTINLYSRDIVSIQHEMPDNLNRALLYTLQMVSGDPEFQGNVLEVLSLIPGTRVERAKAVIPAAYELVLRWQPASWAIPSEEEISRVEQLMFTPEERPSEVLKEHFGFACQCRWFFSAAAIATNYLEKHSQHRALMRKIILNEAHMSISNSEHHLSGLSHLCDGTARMRVVRHVRLWSSIYYHCWSHLQQLSEQSNMFDGSDEDDEFPELVNPRVADLLPAIAEWLREAVVLRQQAPGFHFALKLENYPSHFWNLMRDVAVLQEVMTEQYRRRSDPAPQAERVGPPIFGYFTRPCDVFPEFTQAIRDIISGSSSCFKVDSAFAEIWDMEQLLLERGHWTIETWQSAWQDLLRKQIKLPEGGRRVLARGYWIENPHPTTTCNY